MAVEKLNIHKSPGIDQIPAELTKAGGRTVRSEIHKLNNLIWNKEELCEDWKESIIVPIYKKGDNCEQNCIPPPAVKANSTCRGNYWGSSMWISTQ
jgi:hypothetical protein